MLTPSQAATAVGLTKAGIIRAIQKGRLSATRNVKGGYEIDPVELFRVYTPVSTGVNSDEKVGGDSTAVPDIDVAATVKVELLERIIRDKDDVIADLRRRLDAEAEERQKLAQRLLAEPAPPPAPKNFWARLFGR